MIIYLFGHLLAVAIGVSLGLLGGGGSVLALPVLVYVMGIDPKPAIAMTLVIVGSVSFLGVIPHARQGNVRWKTAAVFGAATMAGAYGGARLAGLPWISGTVQMLIFGVAMLLAAGLMIYRTARPKSLTEPANTLEGTLYTPPICKYCWLWLLTEGIGVGVLTGLVGVGGGFAIVPALVLLAKIPMRQAIATSLIIISANSVAGLLGYATTMELDWHLTLSFTLAAAIGTLVGIHLGQFIPTYQLQKGFGYFLLAIATFVLIQNLY
ncbi:sulfite exporter TauE/SafE family protein [Candidatus Synechococcus calcipolaris G9]|uniref:Probable membrane transporter protein n=1 Tax=Candidatus Synechococcus calcipolaris G9 TaxID=1497997 RepID=A0ABT6EU23_9SYNE|nr:sulfite exporter TauE/SafE family protein [Candidatus Synechococcus calcipolaris]MDG2989399.1 sulfite exporter TauE/SafE family protein [Candidatus Synechococcus calcipolaris G9]